MAGNWERPELGGRGATPCVLRGRGQRQQRVLFAPVPLGEKNTQLASALQLPIGRRRAGHTDVGLQQPWIGQFVRWVSRPSCGSTGGQLIRGKKLPIPS